MCDAWKRWIGTKARRRRRRRRRNGVAADAPTEVNIDVNSRRRGRWKNVPSQILSKEEEKEAKQRRRTPFFVFFFFFFFWWFGWTGRGHVWCAFPPIPWMVACGEEDSELQLKTIQPNIHGPMLGHPSVLAKGGTKRGTWWIERCLVSTFKRKETNRKRVIETNSKRGWVHSWRVGTKRPRTNGAYVKVRKCARVGECMRVGAREIERVELPV